MRIQIFVKFWWSRDGENDHVVNGSRDDEQNQNIHDNSFHSRYEYLNDPKGPEFESD